MLVLVCGLALGGCATPQVKAPRTLWDRPLAEMIRRAQLEALERAAAEAREQPELAGLAGWTARVPAAPGGGGGGAHADAVAENLEIIESLFKMGLKATDVAGALDAGLPAGGIDRSLESADGDALRVAALPAGLGAEALFEPAEAEESAEEPQSASPSWLELLAQIRGSGRAASVLASMSVEDAAALNDALRLFLDAIPASAPVREARLTSGFGLRRHPISGRLGAHVGSDFVSNGDRRVRASRDGVVRVAERRGGYGNTVIVDHEHGFETRYAHLESIAVRPGQRLREGELLGVMGSTGLSTGVHLHFELRFVGRALDPVKAIAAARARKGRGS